ncbi:MAG: trypsin-like peptidase domain-containing protein [Dehalococcoidia bacterium]|nr:trypsin-like peptidase domain-containing protein [Dehalococcoidia bacterium]
MHDKQPVDPVSQPDPPPTRIRPQFGLALRQARPFLLGIAATLLAILAYQSLAPAPAPLTTTDVDDRIAQAMASATPPPAYSAAVYQFILPSLVLIQTERANPATEDESFGVGSGVVVNDTGAILTALHVVADAAAILVTFADGTQANAAIIAAQPENDIAVLQADQLPTQFLPATLGSPNGMRIGDEAYAVGNPLGLAGSLSAGVISGFNRSFTPRGSDQRLEGLIQFDAAVNPGNSGGPLLNRSGQVVGIVTGLVNPTDENFFIGIGFAVPIDVAGGAAGLPPQ